MVVGIETRVDDCKESSWYAEQRRRAVNLVTCCWFIPRILGEEFPVGKCAFEQCDARAAPAHQRVEEVARAAEMDTQPARQRLGVQRSARQLGEA